MTNPGSALQSLCDSIACQRTRSVHSVTAPACLTWALVVVTTGSTVWAQTPVAPSPALATRAASPSYAERSDDPPARSVNSVVFAPPIAVCDVTEVLRRDPTFLAQMDALRHRGEDLDRSFRLRLRQAQGLREKSLEFVSGSPERMRYERDFAQALATIQSDTALQKKALLTEEAHIYYDAYVRVRRAIADYTAGRNTVVVRYQRYTPDGTDHHGVQDWVNSWIVYQHGADLTDHLVQRLDAGRSSRLESSDDDRATERRNLASYPSSTPTR